MSACSKPFPIASASERTYIRRHPTERRWPAPFQDVELRGVTLLAAVHRSIPSCEIVRAIAVDLLAETGAAADTAAKFRDGFLNHAGRQIRDGPQPVARPDISRRIELRGRHAHAISASYSLSAMSETAQGGRFTMTSGSTPEASGSSVPGSTLIAIVRRPRRSSSVSRRVSIGTWTMHGGAA